MPTNAKTLHVIAVYSNPVRWETRLRLQRDFEQHMLESGISLTTVECAFGDLPFDLEDHPNINRVRVRSKTMVWNKENLINIGISRLPDDWGYVAWIDADIMFRRKDWAVATLNALQHYDIVQPWTTAYDLGPQGQHLQAHNSFMSQFFAGKPVVPDAAKFWVTDGGYYEYPHPGYAWAATRRTMQALGGLIECGALGSGDHHMATALVGAVVRSVPKNFSPSYLRRIDAWQARALHHLNFNFGAVSGVIEHFWHGKKSDRRYRDRWSILIEHGFCPDVDLKRNTYGVTELAGNKPDLRRAMDHYFRQRNEDANSM